MRLHAVSTDDYRAFDFHSAARPTSDDAPHNIVFQQEPCGRSLDHHLSSGLGCLLGQDAIEDAPLQDVTLAPLSTPGHRCRILDNGDLGLGHHCRDPVEVWLDEGLQHLVRHSLCAAHRRANLLAFLQQQNREAQPGSFPRRYRSSRPRPHDHHIVAPSERNPLGLSIVFCLQSPNRAGSHTQAAVKTGIANEQMRLRQLDGPHRTNAHTSAAIAAAINHDHYHRLPPSCP